MAFNAKILADSVGPHGIRLTTFELTFPRCILAEFNTHRSISRNAASSRAIPVATLIKRILADPFIPVFARNKKGMQSAEPLTGWRLKAATFVWLSALKIAVFLARTLVRLNIHKQFVNRLLEPWMWVTVIASATEWNNLFALRCHPAAEPSFQKIANMAYDLYSTNEPKKLAVGEWHRPLIDPDEEDAVIQEGWNIFPDYTTDPKIIAEHGHAVGSGLGMRCSRLPLPENEASRVDYVDGKLNKIATGRCARVSYLTHDGKRSFSEDIRLHDQLSSNRPGHWSPFEHIAQCQNARIYRGGNFTGWKQYRKFFEDENIKEFTREG